MEAARKVQDPVQQVKKGDNSIHDSEIAGIQANGWQSKAISMVLHILLSCGSS